MYSCYGELFSLHEIWCLHYMHSNLSPTPTLVTCSDGCPADYINLLYSYYFVYMSFSFFWPLISFISLLHLHSHLSIYVVTLSFSPYLIIFSLTGFSEWRCGCSVSRSAVYTIGYAALFPTLRWLPATHICIHVHTMDMSHVQDSEYEKCYQKVVKFNIRCTPLHTCHYFPR